MGRGDPSRWSRPKLLISYVYDIHGRKTGRVPCGKETSGQLVLLGSTVASITPVAYQRSHLLRP